MDAIQWLGDRSAGNEGSMIMHLRNLFLSILALGLCLAPSVVGQSEQLPQLVLQLQKTPTDNALRENIIKLAASMKPAPALPDQALKYEGRAQFAFKSAKSESDYFAAAQEYEKAVAAAPWVAGYYSDLCTIYEKAGKYADAKQSCGFYLIALSDPNEISDLKKRIAGLDYGIEQAAKAKADAEAAANTPQAKAKAMLATLQKTYGGPAVQLLICGTKLNQYWKCTDAEARASNWMDAVLVDSVPANRADPIVYKIDGKDGEMIRMELGSILWQNGSRGGAFAIACGKPNGDDPNRMTWYGCPDFAAGMANQVFDDVKVIFTTTSSGQPLIEYRDSCGGKLGADSCRRSQFTLKP